MHFYGVILTLFFYSTHVLSYESTITGAFGYKFGTPLPVPERNNCKYSNSTIGSCDVSPTKPYYIFNKYHVHVTLPNFEIYKITASSKFFLDGMDECVEKAKNVVNIIKEKHRIEFKGPDDRTLSLDSGKIHTIGWSADFLGDIPSVHVFCTNVVERKIDHGVNISIIYEDISSFKPPDESGL